jgi:hypothetical protein
MVLELVERTWDSIAWFAGLVGILYVPADTFGFFEAYPQLAALTSTIDRFTVLAVFSALLVSYILWIDVRPFIKRYLSAKPSEEVLRAAGMTAWRLLRDRVGIMGRTRSAPLGFSESGLDDREQRRFMDESSAYSWESIHIYSYRFSSRLSDLFRRLRKIGVDIPPLESDPLLPHWMEDIARFLNGAGPAVAVGDINRVNELVTILKREIRD